MNKILFILVLSLLLFTGCSNNQNTNTNEVNNSNNNVIETKESDEKVSDIKVIIDDKAYTLKLENNKTVEDFINLLPKKFTMNELNGNEKYVYMDNSLSTNSYNPKHIEKGDIMLFGDNCLVIFYKSFDTTYSYTKIGHIDNLENLKEGSIIAKFEK